MAKTITLNDYKQHWISDKPYGSDIVIWSEDQGKLTIKCKRKEMKRDNSGRLTREKNLLKSRRS